MRHPRGDFRRDCARQGEPSGAPLVPREGGPLPREGSLPRDCPPTRRRIHGEDHRRADQSTHTSQLVIAPNCQNSGIHVLSRCLTVKTFAVAFETLARVLCLIVLVCLCFHHLKQPCVRYVCFPQICHLTQAKPEPRGVRHFRHSTDRFANDRFVFSETSPVRNLLQNGCVNRSTNPSVRFCFDFSGRVPDPSCSCYMGRWCMG
jgi:hypothetical protein